MASLLVPPASVQGQNNLDRDAFSTTIEKFPCLHLQNNKTLQINMPIIKKYMLKLKNFKPIQFDNENILVYLDPKKINSLSISEEEKKALDWQNTFKDTKIELKYENWNADEILRSILPSNIEIPNSFSQIGHIVHLNLREEQLPYKNIIGEVFLDKIAHAKTIINKKNSIGNTYRNFEIEILAGESKTEVTVKENGCSYNFDFAKVYWNPRLCTEHTNMVKLLNSGDVLYDVFAGVGPFSIPAARKNVKVLANDLNPESYKWLLKNSKINKVSNLINVFNIDGKDFLQNHVQTDILKRREENALGSEHIVMNLPALSVEFLDVFNLWYNTKELQKVLANSLNLHIYTFIKAGKKDDLNKVTIDLIQTKFNSSLNSKNLLQIHHVRNVAPNKEMMRVSILLTKDFLEDEEPAKKKMKEDNINLLKD